MILLAAGVAGVLPRATHLLETKSYAKHTIRGEQILFADAADQSTDVDSDPGLDRSYILEYSMADGEWWSIMSPNIKGGNSPIIGGSNLFQVELFISVQFWWPCSSCSWWLAVIGCAGPCWLVTVS